MIRKLKNFLNEFLNKIRSFFKRLRNPKMFLADIIYSAYKGDKDKIPLPLFNFVLSQFGPWAGAGIYMTIRKYQFRKKIRKVKKFLLEIVFPIIIFLLLIFAASQSKDNFFFGFAQNALSDIFLLILAIYIVPKILNKPKKFKILISYKVDSFEHQEDFVFLNILLKNEGKEICRPQETYWELYIPKELITLEETSVIMGKCELSNELFYPMWKIFGENSSSIFMNQELTIAKTKIHIDKLRGSELGPPKFYYSIFTINGNCPEFENISQDFAGLGISLDKYPIVGDLVINDWYVSNDGSQMNYG